MSHKIAFPTFDDQQMDAVAHLGQRITFRKGDVLIGYGEKDYPFYVIETGVIDIREKDEQREAAIASHGPREFSGDVDMLTGRSSLFMARAASDGHAYKLCSKRLRKLLGECPRVGDLLLEAFQARRQLLPETPFTGIRVIGPPKQADVNKLREFLYKNHVPYTFFESDSQQGQRQLAQLEAEGLPLPVVRCNGKTIARPSLTEIANCIGIHHDVDQKLFDLVIVGAGPAGLAASVYASSEGLRVLVIDAVGPGGQAGSSSRIENFMGFPSGLSGSELAGRGYLQALKFGATFLAPVTVEAIETSPQFEHTLKLSNGQSVLAKCVLVTTGVSYRQLSLPGCQDFEGSGVYYAATSVEARNCEAKTAVVVGGGNSAGQAAMFLAERAAATKILIRGDDLAKSMSEYLCHRILNHPSIEVIPHTEVQEVCGDSYVQSVRVRDNKTTEVTELPCSGLFIFIGAKPHTAWLPEGVMLDEKGFVLTASTAFAEEKFRELWPLDRGPCDLETSLPGVLAAGDVRSGTTKRCGFAVGDGSLAVACVHRYLSQL